MALMMRGTAPAASATFVILCFWRLSEAFGCKFSNEACEDNAECCSGKCVDAHPGTNARCTKLSLHKPCLYSYQCEGSLRCGRQNKCCAKYWGTCSHDRDCCDPAHKCFDVEGFYYKRCLYSNNLNQTGPACMSCTVVTLTLSLLTLLINAKR